MEIKIVPLFERKKEWLVELYDALSRRFSLVFELTSPISLPPSLKPKGGGISAFLVIEFLFVHFPLFSKVIGITGLQILTFPYGASFGVTDATRRVAVISISNIPPFPKVLFLERLAKVTIHELGHLMGLDHCSEKDCLMSPSEGKIDLIDKKRRFCPSHRRAFAPFYRGGQGEDKIILF